MHVHHPCLSISTKIQNIMRACVRTSVWWNKQKSARNQGFLGHGRTVLFLLQRIFERVISFGNRFDQSECPSWMIAAKITEDFLSHRVPYHYSSSNGPSILKIFLLNSKL